MAATGVALFAIPVVGEEGAATKAVNLPAWRKIAIDMEHILSGHTEEGARVVQSGLKDVFPKGMSPEQIERATRQAYRKGAKVGAISGGRVMVEGRGGGLE